MSLVDFLEPEGHSDCITSGEVGYQPTRRPLKQSWSQSPFNHAPVRSNIQATATASHSPMPPSRGRRLRRLVGRDYSILTVLYNAMRNADAGTVYDVATVLIQFSGYFYFSMFLNS